MHDEQTTWEMVSAERLRLADDLEGLTAEQWATPSQCEKWTVRQVAAHLITPFETSTAKFLLTMARHRFNFDATIEKLAAGANAANSTDDIIAKLRSNHDNRWTPPKAGVEIPLSEVVVHGQDIRRVLGIDHEIPAATIEQTLDGIADPDTRSDYAGRIGVPARTS